MKLAYAIQMQQLDKEASKTYGIPGLILMENAGSGTVQALMEAFGELTERTVLIAVGPGNNGGDGLVIARHVLQRGGLPFVFILGDPEMIKGDAATNLNIVKNLNIPIYALTSDDRLKTLENFLPECDLIIDAIFGIGLKKAVKGRLATVIELINQAAVPVISVDIPSGLNSDSGMPMGISVEADLTVTYGLAKPGHFTGLGPEKCGQLVVVEISIPRAAIEAAGLQTEVLENQSVSCLVPDRPASSHKGTFGHLMVLAGSRGKTGAALLCARGALRGGSGLVTIFTPHDLNQIFETALAEAMTLPLGDQSDGYATIADYEEIGRALTGKQALVIGPGLGEEESTGQLVSKLYQEQDIPMVVDADALNFLAPTFRNHPGSPGIRILTPHPGEMARLIGSSTDLIQANRLEAARKFATAHQVFVVLKGARTIIAGPDGRTAINSTGNPALAAGGTGDVLAGLIGSLLAQGSPPWEAACLGVYAHGLAADRIIEDNDIRSGLLASELADELPAVLAWLMIN